MINFRYRKVSGKLGRKNLKENNFSTKISWKFNIDVVTCALRRGVKGQKRTTPRVSGQYLPHPEVPLQSEQ